MPKRVRDVVVLMLLLTGAARNASSQQTEDIRLWLRSNAPAESPFAGRYVHWLLYSPRFRTELPTNRLRPDESVSYVGSQIVKMWHVRIFRRGSEANTRLPLVDLLFDDNGYLVGFTQFPDLEPLPDLQWQQNQLSRDPLQHTPFQQRIVGVAVRSDAVVGNVLSPLLRPLVADTDVEMLGYLMRHFATRELSIAPDTMTFAQFTATHSEESTTRVTTDTVPIWLLIDKTNRVQAIGIGEHIVTAQARRDDRESSSRADATPIPVPITPVERIIRTDERIRSNLRSVLAELENPLRDLPTIGIEGRTYYLAEQANEAVERVRSHLLYSFDAADAIKETVAAIMQTSEYTLKRDLGDAHTGAGGVILVSQNPSMHAVPEGDLKAVFESLRKLAKHVLSFETLHPDVKCVSVPPGAHVVIQVGKSKASERFTDTDGTIGDLWRGIYTGTAVVKSGGYQPAEVALDIFNQKKAGIVCTFERPDSPKKSVCLQTSGE